jgi:hypothetical protein
MDRRGTPGGWDSPDRPSVVQVTVESEPGQRIEVRRAHLMIAIAVLGAIAAVVVIAVLPGGGPGSAPPRATTFQTPAPHTPAPTGPTVLVDSGPPSDTGVGSYRFPLGCLGSVLGGGKEAGSGPCRRDGGYVTAILRRVGGRWRVTLKATNPPCPEMPLPAVMRRHLRAACRR